MTPERKFRESIWGSRGLRPRSTNPEYYVYVLIRHNGDAIYVGKGKGRRCERDFTKEGENSRLAAIITQDREAGLPAPTLAIAKRDMLESEAFALEAQLIGQHGRVVNGGTLVNMTNGGLGRAPGAEAAGMERYWKKLQVRHARNQERPAVLELNECLTQLGIRSDSMRGVVLARLLERPATLQELAERIGRTPALGDKGDQPAVKRNVYAALRHLRRKAHECCRFEVVERAGVYSLAVKP
jgi:hypothetical protein